MNSKKRRHPSRPPSTGKDSEVRPAATKDERRRVPRWHSDADVEVLSPIQQIAEAVDVSKAGMQLSLDQWLSAGTVCDLRITTHTGRTMLKRARVLWTRREGKRCVSGLEVMGSIAPHASDEE